MISPTLGTIDSFNSPKIFSIDSEIRGAKGFWLLKKKQIPRCTGLKVPKQDMIPDFEHMPHDNGKGKYALKHCIS